MGKTLYLECYAGISGDMTAAALLDLGADEKKMREVLSSLPMNGYEIETRRVKKAGIDAFDFNVILDKEHENHDHDMEYLHGEHAHSHEHHHEETEDSEHIHNEHHHEETDGEHIHNEHHHEESGAHEHHHAHAHRGFSEVLEILNAGNMTERARKTAISVFQILAEAEAKAHGTTVEEVHFHEVGAVDSIADIVAVSVCLDDLNIDEVIIPVLYEGRGFVRCQHGIMSVPVPAVVNILTKSGLKLHQTETEGEFVTPTGAAIAAAIQTKDKLPFSYTVDKIGYGAGKRTYERPSLLRAMLITPQEKEEDTVCKLECNVDDCAGEAFGYCMERLFEAGARDVFYTPVFMKKNRPAYLLTVICDEDKRMNMEEILFRETTTIGVRRTEMKRTILKREHMFMQTPFGTAQIKVCTLPDGTLRYYPEYESVKEIAKTGQMSYEEAFSYILEKREAMELRRGM